MSEETRSRKRRIYKVIFMNKGETFEIYAKSVSQDQLYGFVEVEQIVFGERSSVVVDPSEDRLKQEFDGVKRTYIPMHAVIRIDEVEKEGTGRISANSGDSGTLTPFPAPNYPPPKKG